MTPAEKRQVLLDLGRVLKRRPADPRGWADRLRLRELAGERLTPAQREAWRDALRAPGALPTDADDAGTDYAAHQRRQDEQERIRQYAAERGIPLANGG